LDFDKLIYQFHDASVLPEYHRSYDITITKDKICKLIHSYGDTISYITIKIAAKNFYKLLTTFSDSKISNCQLGDSDGCTGGTGVSISCFENNNEIFRGHFYKCGGVKYGNLCGETNDLLSYLNELLETK